MGNYRFRLSDMIPNAWFYKLKNMSSRTRKHNNTSHSHSHSTKKKKPTSTSAQQKPHLSQKKDSYYFTTKPTRAAADKSCNSSSINTKASDTRFPEPPSRILSTKRTKRKAVYKPSPKAVSSSASPAAHCGCHATLDSVWTDETNPIQSPDYFGFSSETNTTDPDFHELIPSQFECHHFGASDPLDGQAPWSSSYNCRVSSSTADTIIGMKNGASTNKVHDQKQGGCDMISELELPPILTKPVKVDDDHKATHEATKFRRSSSELKGIEGHRSLTVKIVKEERSIRTQKGIQKANSNSVRKSCATSTGIRLRGNSPRLGSKKTQFCAPRKSVSSSPSSRLKPKNRCLSESFAVVKSSLDPQRDFRDSMMEMIVENNIRASKDLEDLLACYLSLNSSEYHDLIVKAFEQIWFDMADIKM